MGAGFLDASGRFTAGPSVQGERSRKYQIPFHLLSLEEFYQEMKLTSTFIRRHRIIYVSRMTRRMMGKCH